MFSLAESGVFKRDGLNHIDSVKAESLYKVFTYLSWKNAKADYDGAVQEAIHSDKK